MTSPRLHKAAPDTRAQGADAMSKQEESARQHPGVAWRSIDLAGAELDIEAKGGTAFSDLEDLWYVVRGNTVKNKKPSQELASRLTQHLASELADYIATFPEGTHLAVARSIIRGMLHQWMYYDTDAI